MAVRFDDMTSEHDQLYSIVESRRMRVVASKLW